jgi:hypothetical protein
MKGTKKDTKNLDFSGNLNYALSNLKKVIDEANDLEDKIYLEISKSQIIKYLNYAYTNIKDWQTYYESKEYDAIINNYKEIESIISQLELCLADYDDKFHIDGISYSIFQIGKVLSIVKKGSDINGK